MKWTLINQAGTNDPDTGDIYSGLDRFGRVKDNRWIDGEGEDLDRIQYGYDRASNRIWRKNVVAASLGKQFDELYTYDGVHRLKDMVRGTLNGGHTALTSETFAESWTLDSTGNWRGFKLDDNGDGTWSLIQSRTANPVNEITDIAESVGPSWVTPAYNRAGNMTTMPQPADPTTSYTATYDAWNRLVKIADGADTVSEYAYDGAKRRILQNSYVDGSLDETRHLYYTEPSLWQVIEERLGTSPDSADAERQFVWSKQYIDDLILRDRDTDANGSLDERLYACQDGNWNVTTIVISSAEVQERFAYSAYGIPSCLTDAYEASIGSFIEFETLFCGYRWSFTACLFDARYRSLHASAGAWCQRDPLGLLAGANSYEYSASSPIGSTDPFGLFNIQKTYAIGCEVPGACKVDCDRDWNDCIFNFRIWSEIGLPTPTATETITRVSVALSHSGTGCRSDMNRAPNSFIRIGLPSQIPGCVITPDNYNDRGEVLWETLTPACQAILDRNTTNRDLVFTTRRVTIVEWDIKLEVGCKCNAEPDYPQDYSIWNIKGSAKP